MVWWVSLLDLHVGQSAICPGDISFIVWVPGFIRAEKLLARSGLRKVSEARWAPTQNGI
jgi:hypothetical protein